MAGIWDTIDGMFMPGNEGIGELLGEEERKRIANQAWMSTAAKLLASSGRSTQPVSLGQALGGAYLTGQEAMNQGVTNAAQNLLLKQKISEAQNKEKIRAGLADAMRLPIPQDGPVAPVAGPVSTPADPGAMTPAATAIDSIVPKPVSGPMSVPLSQEQMSLATPLPGGPTPRPSIPSSQPSFNGVFQKPTMEQLRAQQMRQGADFLAKNGQIEEANHYMALAEKLDPRQKPSFGSLQVGKNGNYWALDANTGQMVDTRVPAEVKPDPGSAGIREYEYAKTQGYAGSFEQWKRDMARAGAANVSLNAGQKGWENVSGLRKDFRSEPIYKTFEDMRDAYGQVQTALQQGNPIGDVAGATKMMKLLDPGSVVRESELGIAMAASGRMDRLRNFFSMWASGEKLTPTQRAEFLRLSNELMAATSDAYNKKRKEYELMGNAYLGQEPTGLALGSPVPVPSLMGGGAIPGAAPRKPLGDIFGR